MRIVAGTAGGRSIKAPEGRDTRPTLARVKEAMFGAVQFDLAGARVLDLFAGSGNLGFEALSRGAADCVFADSNPVCRRLISENAAELGMTSKVRVMRGDALGSLAALAAEGYTADIVFLDPPYKTTLLTEALAAICDAGLLSSGGTVVAEHSPDNPPSAPETLTVKRPAKRYGDVAFAIYTRGSDV